MHESYYNSPAGVLLINASEDGITELSFVKESDQNSIAPDSNPLISECILQLEEYFSGIRKTFSIPLDPQGTDFQKQVWAELQKIPFGKTTSYLELAKNLGDVKKNRAVGGANSKNPVAIIVPCHRVIGSDGSMTGYTGGMDKKRWLLHFEGSIQQDLFT